MTPYADRVHEVAAIVGAVEGSGLVHSYTRNTPQWEQFLRYFLAPDGRINGWQITRRSAATATQRWQEGYQLVKVFGMRDADATDLTFQQNLDDVAREFVQGRDLTFGSVAEGFRITGIEERMFGGTLCHVAECEITVSFYTHDL
jgi:hypothetical protein